MNKIFIKLSEYFKKILRLFTIIHYDIKKIDDKLEVPERLKVKKLTSMQPTPVQQMTSQMQQMSSQIQQMSSQVQPLQSPLQPMQPQTLNDNDFPIFTQFLPMNDIESINHFEMLIATNTEAVVQFVSWKTNFFITKKIKYIKKISKRKLSKVYKLLHINLLFS